MLIQDKIASWRGLEAYLTTDEMSRVRAQAGRELVRTLSQKVEAELFNTVSLNSSERRIISL